MHRYKRPLLYLCSALIPWGVYLITFFLLDVFPFGSDTMLVSDACYQYVDFASYWKTILAGENDLFYTFTKTLGGNGYNFAAYYLLSPFNLLYLFSTTETVPQFFTIIFLLKIGMCGLSFFALASHLYGCSWKNLIFSTAYALMAYNVVFGIHTMWLDGVMILPIIYLGIIRLFEQKPGIKNLYIYILPVFHMP